MKRLHNTTDEFVKLLAEFAKCEIDINAMKPYKDIIENMSYVLPYTKGELVNKFNKHLND